MSTPELSVTFRHGADYAPSARLAAAIDELVAALHDEHDATQEVAGFSGLPTGKRMHKPVIWDSPVGLGGIHTVTMSWNDGGITVEDDWEA